MRRIRRTSTREPAITSATSSHPHRRHGADRRRVFGAGTAILVKESETDVPLPLGDILSAPHAINVHESAEAIQNYIACGDIGGRVIDGDLVIGLRELNDSGHHGVAVLEGDDDGTDVTLYLARKEPAPRPSRSGHRCGPAATDAPATPLPRKRRRTPRRAPRPGRRGVPVDIRDFAYSPNPIEIAAGDTVTWTNQDEVPHTATGEDRDVLQSGTISPEQLQPGLPGGGRVRVLLRVSSEHDGHDRGSVGACSRGVGEADDEDYARRYLLGVVPGIPRWIVPGRRAARLRRRRLHARRTSTAGIVTSWGR